MIGFSLHGIGQVVVGEDLLVLFVGNAEAVEEIVSVGLAEHGAVGEGGGIGGAISVVLDGLHDVSESLSLKLLLGDHGVQIVALNGDVGQVSLIDISRVHWVSHQSLVIRNWPGWGRHNSQGVVSLWVDGSE